MTNQEMIYDISKLFLGGVIGTILTTLYKDFKDKKNDRKRMFLRLMASKSYIQITQAKIEDLNMIEILFRGRKTVLEKYRLYHEELCQPDGQQDYNRQEALYWDLLRSMGNEVGYKNLDNKTLHNRYIPNAALDEHLFSKEMQAKLLEYLKSGHELQRLLIDNSNNSTAIAPVNP